MGQIHSQGEKAEKCFLWVDLADSDYFAARLLLLNDALVQGSVLSNTTIEKYLKSLFVISDLKVPKIHNICKLYNKIKTAGIELKINEEYLALLFKSYLLRYPFDLPAGFNIGLYRAKLLVELDHTVYEIRKGFSFGLGIKK